jgi:hypothetical protein
MRPIEQPEAVSPPHNHREIDLAMLDLIREHLQRGVRGLSSGQFEIMWTAKLTLLVADCLRQRPDTDAEQWKSACRRCCADLKDRFGSKLPTPGGWLPRLVLFLLPRSKQSSEEPR